MNKEATDPLNDVANPYIKMWNHRWNFHEFHYISPKNRQQKISL